MPHDSPLRGGHTPGSNEGSKKLNELTVLCTKLSDKVTSLEEDLKQTKKVYGKALKKLVKKVKQLEDKLKSTPRRRKTRMIISDDEEELISEDTSKQERKINEIDQDPFISLIGSGDTEVIKGIGDTEVLDIEKETSTAHIPVSTASASETVSTAAPRTPPTTTTVFDDEDFSMAMAQTLIKIKEEVAHKLHDEEVAQKLHDEEMARDAARKEHKMTDFKKALELQKLLKERKETGDIDWNVVVQQVQERQSDAIKRYQTLKRKPVSVAQARKNMIVY
ncbi:hypothetical protein Tco_0746217 [Tanacetum coccineum]|uniref:Uncharacterized protein n=1 Tax=Tanacetum coccineum TaxID=301880 RepID=A0ABQ5G519_9ASTR